MTSRINRVVCIAASVTLSLCMLPATAFAAVGEALAPGTAVSGGTVVVEDVDSQEMDIASLTAIDEFELDENGAPSLREGNYENWIDRVKLPSEYIALYNTLVDESRDASGCLVSPQDDESIPVISGSIDLGTVTYTTSTASEQERKEEVTAYVKSLLRDPVNTAIDKARTYTYAAANAFDADHPEVFWLSGTTTTNSQYSYSWSGSVSQSGSQYTYALTVDNSWKLNYTVKDSKNNYDARASEYRNVSAIAADMSNRDADVAAIVDEITGGGAIWYTYKQLYFLNRWLTSHNDYNTAVSQGNDEAASRNAWECISALDGRSGTEGPVCEGYARAFKVICDEIGIPCTLVQGIAKSSASGTGGPHMWNYVKVEGAWYAEDATWNDPVGAFDTSGNDRYLLVGADTVIGDLPFIESHPVSNRLSSDPTGVSFTNGPVLESKSYLENLENKEVLCWNGEINEANEGRPAYILANKDGSCPADRILSSLTVNEETPDISRLEFFHGADSISIDDIHSGEYYRVKLRDNEYDKPISFAVVKPNDIWLLGYWIYDEAHVEDGTVRGPEIHFYGDEDIEYVSGVDFQLEYYDPETGAPIASGGLQPEHGYLAIPVFPAESGLVKEFNDGIEFYVKGANNLSNWSCFSFRNWGEAFIDENGLLNLGGFELVQWDEELEEDVALPANSYELLVYTSWDAFDEGEDPIDLNAPVDVKTLKNAILVYRAVEDGPYVGEGFCDLRLFGKHRFATDCFCVVDGVPQLSVVAPCGDEHEDTLVPPSDYRVRLYENDDYSMENEIAPENVVLGELYRVTVEGITQENSNSLFIYKEEMKAVSSNDISLYGCSWEGGGVLNTETGAFMLPKFSIFDYGQYEDTAREPGFGYEVIGVSKWDDEADDYVDFELSAIDTSVLDETLRFTLKGVDGFDGITYGYCFVECPTNAEAFLDRVVYEGGDTVSTAMKVFVDVSTGGITDFAFTVDYDTSQYRLKGVSCDPGSVYAAGTLTFDSNSNTISWHSDAALMPNDREELRLDFGILVDDPTCTRLSLKPVGEYPLANGDFLMSCDYNEGAILARHAWVYDELLSAPTPGEHGMVHCWCDLCDDDGERGVLFGDLNIDGSFDVRDLVLMQRHLASREGFSQAQLALADVYGGDGVLNMKDLITLTRQLLE